MNNKYLLITEKVFQQEQRRYLAKTHMTVVKRMLTQKFGFANSLMTVQHWQLAAEKEM